MRNGKLVIAQGGGPTVVINESLEHFPIRWNHLIGTNAPFINELEHYSRANQLGKCSSRGHA